MLWIITPDKVTQQDKDYLRSIAWEEYKVAEAEAMYTLAKQLGMKKDAKSVKYLFNCSMCYALNIVSCYN